jgi:peroxiredoxin Q/BCP
LTIEEGKKAPLFTLENAKGEKVALREFKGKKVVVYFYPKDETPGCTKEACAFRDLSKEFRKLNTVILGVSPDDAASHKAFARNHKLRFNLLCDPSKKVMEKYEAWGEKVLYGRKSIGVIRSTVLIDEQGKVTKHWKRAGSAADHPQRVLNVLQKG